jgi:hypothetical protein
MPPRSIVPTAIIALLGVALFLFILWSPERQVRLHQEHLLAAVSDKNWARVASFIAEDYSDRWGHDKAFVAAAAREVFAQFIALDLSMQNPMLNMRDGNGEVAARLIAKGSGGPFAQMAIDKLQELREPFTFHWQKRIWKPWDWKLTRLNHPTLEVPAELPEL